MEYSPVPSAEQLATLSDELCPGGSIDHERRLTGGLGCTMDVILVQERGGSHRKMVLRRYFAPAREQGIDPVPRREMAALALAGRNGVPVPELIWADELGIFSEPALVISYIEGMSLLQPNDPLDWAKQLALALVNVHAADIDAATRSLLRDVHKEEVQKLHSPDPPIDIAEYPGGRAIWGKRRALFAGMEFPTATFVHGDFHPGNTLWRDMGLVSVVDWEDAGFADPASDVAYCSTDMRYMGMSEAAQRLVDVYTAETGRVLTTLPYWEIAALCRPMPDIARWFPSWEAVGFPATVDDFRRQHAALVERALSS
ncbi:MAG: aminoglycoside phosphotransferase family protein [Dehalococcoidia bacterium]